MADSSHDPVQQPPGTPNAPAVGPAYTGEHPSQHRCQHVPSRWSRFHLAGQQQQPSQPCCNVAEQWRHRQRQQQQPLFGVAHYGWVFSKWYRGRPSFPRRRFSSSSNSHRESTPTVTSDLPKTRGAQNDSTLSIIADPMSAGLLSGSSQHSGWTNWTPVSTTGRSSGRALPGTRQRRRSWTVITSVILAVLDWQVPRDHGR